MATPGPVTITCPLCREAFTVPTEVLGIDGHQVVVRMDRSEVYGHMAQCAAKPAEQTTPETKGKALQRPPAPGPIIAPPFVAKGKRTCTMCGVAGPECLQRLERSRKGCCPACESGNTHPAPHDTVPCATWAADR